jgi:hypothetical protein
MRRVGNFHGWEKGEVHTGHCWGCLKEGDHFEDLGVHWKNKILRCIFRKLEEETWTGLIFFRLGTEGGVL